MAHSKRKKNRTLLFQIALVIFLLILVIMNAAVWLFYKNTINSYLTGQNIRISTDLTETYESSLCTQDLDIINWMYDFMRDHPDTDCTVMTEEEMDIAAQPTLEGELAGYEVWSVEWLESLPEDKKVYIAKSAYYGIEDRLWYDVIAHKYEQAFIMSTRKDNFGTLFYSYKADGNSREFGERCNIDLSEHEALKKAIESNTEDIVFERTTDFPEHGSYYVAYKPLVLNGKTKSVLFVAYNWDAFKESIKGNLRATILIIAAGSVIMMTMEMNCAL